MWLVITLGVMPGFVDAMPDDPPCVWHIVFEMTNYPVGNLPLVELPRKFLTIARVHYTHVSCMLEKNVQGV